MLCKLVISILTLAAAPALFGSSLVVPGAQTSVEGNQDNSFPFDIADVSISTMRYQQVYSSTEFSGPILITGIDFRPEAFVSGVAFSSTLSSVQIDLSTTTRAVDGLSNTFSNNVGADNVTVLNGSLSLSSSVTGPDGGPKDFDIHIVFTTAFLYDPSLGNLLLDVRNFGGGKTTFFDAQNETGDAVSRVFTTVADGVNNATGSADSLGLVTQFQFGPDTATPEPATVWLTGSALLGGLLLAIRRRRA